MARKGERKIMKVYTAPKTMRVKRNKPKLVTGIRCGPHNKKAAVPISVVLRDLLEVADNNREVKVMLNEGRVKVDGKTVKDERRAIGFMDVVSFPSISKHYRVVYDKKGRLVLEETDQPQFKLCKILNKTQIKKGFQLNLHDGKNLVSKEKKYAPGGTLKVSLPTLEVKDYYPMQEGSVAYVYGGTHAGETGTIKNIIPGTLVRDSLVVLETKQQEFQSRKDYVFVLGTKTPVIDLEERKGETK
jgi:small subunit ribosomal protein S4e